MVLHPGVAKISCAECQKTVFNFDTGEPETYLIGEGQRAPVPRPPQIKPPCDKCPKKGPEHEQDHILSEQNILTFLLYQQVRATGGACLSDHEREDWVLTENLMRVDQIVRFAEEQRAAGANSLQKLMMGTQDA